MSQSGSIKNCLQGPWSGLMHSFRDGSFATESISTIRTMKMTPV